MKVKNQIAIGIVCVVLGFIISLQYKVFQDSLSGGVSLFKKQTDLTNELFVLKEEKDQLNEELNDLRAKLQGIEESASQDNAIIKNLKDTVRQYEILAGMTDVKGEGVVITIDNPPADQNLSNESVSNNYRLIVELINELNASGAEAISINEQRIISISEVRAAGNKLNVNFVPQSTPLEIKAIGKKSALEGALTFRYGIANILREDHNLIVDVKALDQVVIPRYHGLVNFQYVKTVEDE